MSVISNTERALSVAVEHIYWAKMQGLKPEDVMRSVGWHRVAFERSKTWPEAVDAVADAWRALA